MSGKTELIQKPTSNISKPETETKAQSSWSGRKVEMLVGGTLIVAGAAAATILWPVALAVGGVGAAILLHGYLRTPSKNLEENRVSLLPAPSQQPEPPVEISPITEQPPLQAQAPTEPEVVSQLPEQPAIVEPTQPQVPPTLTEKIFSLLGAKPFNEETAPDMELMLHDAVVAFEGQDTNAFKFIFDEFAQNYPVNAPAVATLIRRFAKEQMFSLLGAKSSNTESASDSEQMLHDMIEALEEQDEKTFKFILEEFAVDHPEKAQTLEPLKNLLKMTEQAISYLPKNGVITPFQPSPEGTLPSQPEEPVENPTRKRWIAGGLALLSIAAAVTTIVQKINTTPTFSSATPALQNKPTTETTPEPKAPEQLPSPIDLPTSSLKDAPGELPRTFVDTSSLDQAPAVQPTIPTFVIPSIQSTDPKDMQLTAMPTKPGMNRTFENPISLEQLPQDKTPINPFHPHSLATAPSKTMTTTRSTDPKDMQLTTMPTIPTKPGMSPIRTFENPISLEQLPQDKTPIDPYHPHSLATAPSKAMATTRSTDPKDMQLTAMPTIPTKPGMSPIRTFENPVSLEKLPQDKTPIDPYHPHSLATAPSKAMTTTRSTVPKDMQLTAMPSILQSPQERILSNLESMDRLVTRSPAESMLGAKEAAPTLRNTIAPPAPKPTPSQTQAEIMDAPETCLRNDTSHRPVSTPADKPIFSIAKQNFQSMLKVAKNVAQSVIGQVPQKIINLLYQNANDEINMGAKRVSQGIQIGSEILAGVKEDATKLISQEIPDAVAAITPPIKNGVEQVAKTGSEILTGFGEDAAYVASKLWNQEIPDAARDLEKAANWIASALSPSPIEATDLPPVQISQMTMPLPKSIPSLNLTSADPKVEIGVICPEIPEVPGSNSTTYIAATAPLKNEGSWLRTLWSKNIKQVKADRSQELTQMAKPNEGTIFARNLTTSDPFTGTCPAPTIERNRTGEPPHIYVLDYEQITDGVRRSDVRNCEAQHQTSAKAIECMADLWDKAHPELDYTSKLLGNPFLGKQIRGKPTHITQASPKPPKKQASVDSFYDIPANPPKILA